MPKLQLIGNVIGTAMQKTIKVQVFRTVMHPLYKKYYRQRKNYLVHNENASIMVGDKVKIEECRKISKLKAFQLLEVVKPVSKYVDPETGKIYTAAQPSGKGTATRSSSSSSSTDSVTAI